MKVVTGLENYDQKYHPLYLALGNFDGVHKGHKSLINATVEKARKNGGKAGSLIFDPHPAYVLYPDRAPKLLVNSKRKAKLLEEIGLDILVFNTFNAEIAALSPEEYVKKILVDMLNVTEVFVGFNHSFGSRGAGNPQLLKQLGEKYGFKVNIIAPVTFSDEVVSSSLIRKALEDGDMEKACNMLGYYPLLEGTVIQGEHRSSTVKGFPKTANVGVEANYMVPARGVYAARVMLDGFMHYSVVNIGSKPTFHDVYPISIEAHIMNFEADVYGKEIKLFFVQKIRDEKRFNSVDELMEQISKDCETAMKILLS